jgi:putative salt-induced outer membrane protein YdiY
MRRHPVLAVLAALCVGWSIAGEARAQPPLPPPPDMLPPPANGAESEEVPPTVDWDALMEAVDADAADAKVDVEGEASELKPTPPPAGEDWAWYVRPLRWLPTSGWSNTAEVGLNGTDGNSQTTSMQAGADVSWKNERWKIRSDLNFVRTQANEVETQNNALYDLDVERILGSTPWTTFGELMLEYDEFKAFDLRLAINGGLGYYWIKNDRTSLNTRFGAGTSSEFGGPSEEWKPEAVFGVDAEHRISKHQRLTAKVDYYPSWNQFSDYRLVSDVAWEILLDGSDNLSLKMSANDRYDSTPEGRLPNDINYSALLLYKF